jgi:hypothetical protein
MVITRGTFHPCAGALFGVLFPACFKSVVIVLDLDHVLIRS